MVEIDAEDEECFHINSLFEKDPHEAFYFTDIKIHRDESKQQTEITFCFSYCNRTSIESVLTIDRDLPDDMHHAVWCIGMCVLPWYWMGFGCRRIIINRNISRRTSDVLPFWQQLYSNVLLEYLYCNNAEAPVIEWSESGTDSHKDDMLLALPMDHAQVEDVLVPIGGGKDSLVTWHLSLSSGKRPSLFYVSDGQTEFQQNWRLHHISRVAGSKYHTVRHSFGYEDLRRTSKSYLQPCGHPWAALVLFDAVLVGVLTGHKEVLLGNEKSADFGNGVTYEGVEVNHQYDKSSRFVQAANEYVRKYVCGGITVRSPLENMWDLEVARIFCTAPRLQQLHNVFISCNDPVGYTRWCAKCEKCVFVYLIMSAFLPPPSVWGIFGENLMEKKELREIFLALIGADKGGKKPFECIGTFNESKAAVELSLYQHLSYSAQCSYSSLVRDDIHSRVLEVVPEILLTMCAHINIAINELPRHYEPLSCDSVDVVLRKWLYKSDNFTI